jgi:hypothetical protein
VLRDEVGTGEGKGAHQHAVEHHAERVEVRRCVGVACAHDLLGRHERERAHHRASEGGLRIHEMRDAEVSHLHLPRGSEEDVGRLEVAVHDATPVHGVERSEHRARDVLGDEGRERHRSFALRQTVLERPCGHELHDEQGPVGDVVEDPHHVRMLEARGDPGFAGEAREGVASLGPAARAEHLHGHVAGGEDIVRGEHATRASCAERAQDSVATEEQLARLRVRRRVLGGEHGRCRHGLERKLRRMDAEAVEDLARRVEEPDRDQGAQEPWQRLSLDVRALHRPLERAHCVLGATEAKQDAAEGERARGVVGRLEQAPLVQDPGAAEITRALVDACGEAELARALVERGGFLEVTGGATQRGGVGRTTAQLGVIGRAARRVRLVLERSEGALDEAGVVRGSGVFVRVLGVLGGEGQRDGLVMSPHLGQDIRSLAQGAGLAEAACGLVVLAARKECSDVGQRHGQSSVRGSSDQRIAPWSIATSPPVTKGTEAERGAS